MKLTVKELATKINIVEGTIRSWIMKPEQGKTYSAENINYTNLREKLHKYYEKEAEFEKLVGCKIDDVEITKSERVSKSWVDINNLKKNNVYVIHNYSLQTKVEFKGVFKDTCDIFIFITEKLEYKAYTKEQLSKENIKIEQA